MPTYSYSFSQFDKNKHVRSSLRETDISHKHAREIALAIKGLSIERARNVLDKAIEKEIVSCVIHKGTKLKRFTPRAMGRSSPKVDTLTHVEIVAREGKVY